MHGAKATMHVMEYEEVSLYNLPVAAQNAFISVAKKVKDNVLHMTTTLVIVLQSAAPENLVANPPHALLRAPNALVIK